MSFVIFLSVIGLSYALFNYGISMVGSNAASSSCFKLNFNDNGSLSLMSAVPLSEENALKLDPYSFTIENVCNINANYDINIEVLNDSTLEESEVRYKLDDEDSAILGSRYNADVIVNNDVKVSKKIFSGSLNKNESKTFNLRMWLDSNTTVEKSADKTFYTKVSVVSTFGVKEYNINFDAGELFSEFSGLESYENDILSYVYNNGVITMTAKRDDAYHGFPVYSTLERGKKYHFEIESDGVYGPNGSDSIQVFLRSTTLADSYYQSIYEKSETFISNVDDDIQLRLDVNKNGMTHTFSNWSLKEVIESKRVGKGNRLGNLPVPAKRSGYKFVGWYTEDNKYVNSYTLFNYDNDITLHAKWEKTVPLNINPDGGVYNNSSGITSINRPVGDYYTLSVPTRDGYIFDGWEVNGSGTLMTGQNRPSDKIASLNEIYNEEGYTNYKNDTKYSVSHWDWIRWSNYNAVVGHTYEITAYLRVNSVDNGYVSLRHSAFNNDYTSVGRVYTMYYKSTPWFKYSSTRKFDSEVVKLENGNTNNLQPVFEIYTTDFKDIDFIFDIDIRDVVIKDLDTGEYSLSNDYIYEFGNSEATLTAKWKNA